MFNTGIHALLTAVFVFSVSLATSSAANVTFECIQGWDLIGTHCYNFVNVQLDFEDAVDVCDKYGAELLVVRDEVEAGNVSTIATTKFANNDHYWIYNGKVAQDGNSSSVNNTYCEGMWQPNEPRDTTEDVAIASNKQGRWALRWIWTNLPFVCTAPACPKGSFRCNDGTCLNPQWKCDGTFDCQDYSDESDCKDNIKYYRSSSGTLDTTATADYYQWTIEGQPGEVLKLEIKTLTIESQVDSLRVYSGGASISTSDLIEEIRTRPTGKVTIFGKNHFLIVTLQSQATNLKAALKATWAPDPEVSAKPVDTVSVTDTLQDISSPYFNSPLTPGSFKKEWQLQAPENQLITVEVLNSTFEMNDVFIITNTGFTLKHLEANKNIYISSKNSMTIIVKTKTGKKFFSARVRTGCDFSTNVSLATFSLMDLPNNLACSWTFMNEMSTGLRLRLDKIYFSDAHDSLQLLNMSSSMVLATLNSSNVGPKEFEALPSQVTFKYFSDDVLPGNMIDGRISADCPNIRNTNNLNVTVSSTSENGKAYKAAITCQEGFNFKQEEYSRNQSLSATCNDGGMWDWGSPSYTRVPGCQVVYCGFPPQIRNGFFSAITGNGTYNDTASYQCFPGFQISGSATATCGANGWSQAPTCEAEKCPSVPVVPNASFNFTFGNQSDIGFGTVVQYACEPGYNLLGAQIIVCLTNKTWSDGPPSCQKLTCPLPMVKHGRYNSMKPPLFQETVSLTCDPGYQINRTKTQTDPSISCSANRALSSVDDVCIDIDECSNGTLNNCSSVTQVCNNNEGSYSCACMSGFNGNGTDCADIDECALNICDQNCTNNAGSYQCSCQDGYTLYTENGTNGFYIKAGEDGLKSGDVYQINKTCVPVSCKTNPAVPANGRALKSRPSYFYNETVQIVCDFGYLLEGSPYATCQSDGNWTYTNAPKCTNLTCVQPPPGLYEAFRVPSNQDNIEPGASLIVSCNLNDGSGNSINKTLFCAPDPTDGGRFILQGDDPKCPELNCGPLLNISGAKQPANVSQVYGSSFEFDCDASLGFALVGFSALGNYTVSCQSNGRWGYANLTCEGSRCRDPGTMGGTMQIGKTSYEIGDILEYNCTRPGFTILQNKSLVCDYQNNNATWIGTPPMCEDTTPPMITCPYLEPFDLYSSLVYPKPNVTDNTGLSCFMIDSGPPSGVSVVSTSRLMRYKATDGRNEVSCEFNVTLKDYTEPIIQCQDTVPRDLADNKYEIFNLTEALLVTYSNDGVIKFDPAGPITLTAGSYFPVRASITKANGLVKECAFLVTAVSNICLNDSFTPPENGRIESCTGNNSSMTCTTACNNGYLYQNKANSTSYSCTNGTWNARQPLQPCIKLAEPTFDFDVSLLYITNGNKILNSSQYNNNSCLTSHYNLLAQLVKNMSACGHSNFSAININSTEVGSDSDRVLFTLQLLTNDGKDTDLKSCATEMQANAATLFGPTYPKTDQLSCLSPWNVNATKSTIALKNMSCDGTSIMLDYANKSYCLPCGPGMFFNQTALTCQECQDGYYQDETGKSLCKACPTGVFKSYLPRTSDRHCFELCPEGFTSTSGYVTDNCTPCPIDQFHQPLNNTCQPCPNSGSTLGVSGARSELQCSDPCKPGQYSITGYQPCSSCPINFYSVADGSKQCIECSNDTYTKANGSSSISSCLAATSLCTPSFCNAAGIMPGTTCAVSEHRPVCTCKPGYYGDSCNSSCKICDANPCYNNGECSSTGGLNFTCKCKADASCTFVQNQYITYSSTDPRIFFSIATLDQCRQKCLVNTSCVAYLVEKDQNLCYQYSILLKSSTDNPHQSFEKNCTMKPLFDGPFCERDLTYDCNASVCNGLDFCMDLVGGTQCQCPREGNYDSKCAKPEHPCQGNDCNGHGQCTAFGSIRSVCVCYPGYTGENCETYIDPCSINSNGCLYNGSCEKGNNTYSCSCKNGFSGTHCEIKADFCSPNECKVAEGGICTNDYRNYAASCTCGENYMPDPPNPNTCVPTNYCMNNTCQNGATCKDLSGGFNCECSSGFRGSLCQHKVDECANVTCLNGGTCKSLVNSYTCNCPTGFTGRNCEENINDCNGSCVIENTNGQCKDLIADFQCPCKPEFTGKNCSEDVNECDLYEPCLHGGNCTDKYGGYNCACPPGWTGSNCEVGTNYCNSTPCMNNGKCHNLLDKYFCQCPDGTAGTDCGDMEKVCEKYNGLVCAADGKCQLDGGTAQCQCLEDYSGVACELQKNFCADNPCQNGGVCTLSGSSYECDCSTVKNYGGKNCSSLKSVCNICPAGVLCKEYLDQEGNLQPTCICPGSEIFTGNACTKVDTDYDLAFLEKFASKGTFVTSERGFFLEKNTSISVALWVVAAKTLDKDSVILALKSPSRKDPFLSLFNTRIEFSNNGNDSFDLNSGASNSVDRSFTWHFISISWAANGAVEVMFDVNTYSKKKLTVVPPTDHVVFVQLGNSFYGYISQVSVWSSLLDTSDRYTIFNNKLAVPQQANLLLGWTLYSNDDSVQRTASSSASSLSISVCNIPNTIAQTGPDSPNCKSKASPDKTPPKFSSCQKTALVPTDYSKHQVGSKELGNTITDEPGENLIAEDQFFSYGAYDVAISLVDKAGNVGVCMTRAYITPNKCSSTEPQQISFEKCQDNTNGRKVTCPIDQMLSIPAPKFVMCGKLLTYNLDNMYEPQDRIVCGDSKPRSLTVSLLLPYTTQADCGSSGFFAGFNDTLNSNVMELNKVWPGLCNPNCDNVNVTASCNETMRVHVLLQISGLGERLISSNGTLSLTPQELMTKAVAERTPFDVSGIAGSQFLYNQAQINTLPSCDVGYSLSGIFCVQCGPGSYYHQADGVCKLCDLGKYTSLGGSTSCTDCPTGKTTFQKGSSSTNDCKDNCSMGQMFGGTTCVDCPQNFYQDQSGKGYCFPCPPASGTLNKGAKSISECRDLCKPGTELKGQECVPCQRGFYRDGNIQDNCTACPQSFSTRNNGSTNVTDCIIPKCGPGQYVQENGSSITCQPCDYGFYQPNEGEFECIPCNASYTTENKGAINSSLCRFVCPIGHEEDPASSSSCVPCKRGFYRSNDLDQRFKNCSTCMKDFTTLIDGSTNITDCKIPICMAGTYLIPKNETCYKCPYNTYQNETLQEICKPCPNNLQTKVEGATSLDNCTFACPPGYEVDSTGANCTLCPRGTYKDVSLKFDKCKNCSSDNTTDNQGATDLSMCNIAKCMKGEKVSPDNRTCVKCTKDTYQGMDMPLSTTVCDLCPSNTTTQYEGSTSTNDCKAACEPGFESENGTCKPCQRGTWNNGNDTQKFVGCLKCPTNFTTDVLEKATDAANCSVRDCPPGTYVNITTNECVQCEIGFYQNQSVQTSCIDCPKNTSTKNKGSTDPSDCTIFCQAGYSGESGQCVECADDQFKNSSGFGNCSSCTGDVTSTPGNRTLCTELFCDKGRELKSGICTECDLGSYKPSRGNGTCMRCPGNFTTPTKQSTSDKDCSVTFCDLGFYLENNTTCTSCQVGFFKNESGNDNCTKCPKDLTTDGMGKTSSADCKLKLCSSGQFTNTSNECQDCAIGTYQDLEGQSSCKMCGANSTTLNTGSKDQNDCRVVCPAGRYRNDSVNSCFPCRRGTYQDQSGQSDCKLCANNSTTASEGSASSNQCYMLCQPGTYRSSTSQLCEPCPIGQYQNESDQPSCKSCVRIQSYNASTFSTGSKQEADCYPLCTPGSYVNKTSRSCENCSVGFYKTQTSLDTSCLQCSSGTSTENTGGTSSAACTVKVCGRGKYRERGTSSCKLCPVGKYQDSDITATVFDCTQCPSNKTTLVEGTGSDTYCIPDCPVGQEYKIRNGNCTTCPVGHYRPDNGTYPPTCYYCPNGTTTLSRGQTTCISSPSTVLVNFKTTVSVSVTFEVQECGNPQTIAQALGPIISALVASQNERYAGLCSGPCSTKLSFTILNLCGGDTRSKRQAAQNALTNVTVSNVDAILTDGSRLRSSVAVLEEAFFFTEPARTDLANYKLSLISAQAQECGSQCVIDNDGLPEHCKPGQFLGDSKCQTCPKGTYSTDPVSRACRFCPEGQSTKGINSTSIADCNGECVYNASYCGEKGQCKENTRGISYCECNEGRTGVACTQRVAPEETDVKLVVGVCVGIGAFLLIVLLIVACCAHRRRKANKKKEDIDRLRDRSLESESDAYDFKYPVFSQPMVWSDPTMYGREVMDM